MMRRAARFFALFAFAAMLSGPVPAAFGQDAEAPVISAEELSQIEQMTPEQRDAYLGQKRDAYARMAPEERAQRMAERKAAYDALPEAEKQALQARMKALREDFHRRNYERIQGTKAERARKMKAFLDGLTPEQRRQWDAMEEERKKWENPVLAPVEE